MKKITKVLIALISLIILIVGGFFAWWYFGASQIKSLEIIPSQKSTEGIVYQEGAKAIIIGKNLGKVELYQRGGGTGIYTSPEGGLIGTALKTKTGWDKEIWEVASLPTERFIVELCAVGFDKKGNKVGEVCLFHVGGSAQNINETADWKTYINEEYGFEVKYPKNYFTKEPFPGAINFMENKYKYVDYLFPFLRISFIKTDLKLREYVNGYEIDTSLFFSNKQWVKINGMDVFRYHSNASSGEFDKALIGGEGVVIEFANEINGDVYFPRDIFNQMLSTFKFLK